MSGDPTSESIKPAYLVVKNYKTAETVELPILVDGGPLCIAGVWNWTTKSAFPGLYIIYHKMSSSYFGPFYASIILAEKGMKHALREVPKDVWSHEPEWYNGQNWIAKWIDENLGKAMDLVGGEWEKKPEEKKA